MCLLGLGHRHGGASTGRFRVAGSQPASARPLGQAPFAPDALVSVASCRSQPLSSISSYAGCAAFPPAPGRPVGAGTPYGGSVRSWSLLVSRATFCPICPTTRSATPSQCLRTKRFNFRRLSETAAATRSRRPFDVPWRRRAEGLAQPLDDHRHALAATDAHRLE